MDEKKRCFLKQRFRNTNKTRYISCFFYSGNKAVKIALIQTILYNTVLFKLTLCKCLCNFSIRSVAPGC